VNEASIAFMGTARVIPSSPLQGRVSELSVVESGQGLSLQRGCGDGTVGEEPCSPL